MAKIIKTVEKLNLSEHTLAIPALTLHRRI